MAVLALPHTLLHRPTILPRTIAGYIWEASAGHQVLLSLLSVAVLLLSAAPLEIQRRIINDAIHNGAAITILWLALAYVGVACAEGGFKLALNIYRAWVAENSVRHLRRNISSLIDGLPDECRDAHAEGVEISMILSEVEPIGGFVGISVSEPLLQGGILAAVFSYMIYLQPEMAALCLLVFSPQLVFVPLMQRAINRRARTRIETLREVGGGIIDNGNHEPGTAILQNGRIDRVFVLNMGIFKLKFSMNFLMNLMYHLGVAATLGLGGWYAVQGQIEVGTVVAFVSGLAKINDPWGDIVNWAREMTVVSVKYRLITDATNALVRSHHI